MGIGEEKVWGTCLPRRPQLRDWLDISLHVGGSCLFITWVFYYFFHLINYLYLDPWVFSLLLFLFPSPSHWEEEREKQLCESWAAGWVEPTAYWVISVKFDISCIPRGCYSFCTKKTLLIPLLIEGMQNKLLPLICQRIYIASWVYDPNCGKTNFFYLFSDTITCVFTVISPTYTIFCSRTVSVHFYIVGMQMG